MASPGKRRRKKMGNPAPVVAPEDVSNAPEPAPKVATPKPKKKRKSLFN